MDSTSATWTPTGWRAPAALAALIVVVYARAIACGYIWDDNDYITRNSTLRDVNGLVRIWAEPGATPQYYPLTFTTFWLEYHVWGLHPAGYHAVNVLLHAANAVLVWRVLAALGVPGAWLAAVVFGLHPVHVESVAWITERKNVLSGFLALGSMWLYLDVAQLRSDSSGEPTQRTASWATYLASLALFIGALLSKTIVCSLPAVILLSIWRRRGRITWADAIPVTPFFVVGLALALTTAWMEKTHVGADGAAFAWTFPQRVLIAGPAIWFYFGKIVWPYPLVFMYERWPLDVSSWLWVFPLGAVAAAVIAYAGRARWGRGPVVALLYFYGTLFPALGFISVYPMRYSFVADHFQYLPSLGPIVMISAGLAMLFKPSEVRPAAKRERRRHELGEASASAARFSPGLLVVGGLWSAVLAGLTVVQIPNYQNVETLWKSVLVHNPTCFVALFKLGVVEAERGRFAEAQTLYEAAIAHQTDFSEAAEMYVYLGHTFMYRGLYPQAEATYRRALEYDAEDVEAANALGATLGALGRSAEAEATLREALKKHPQKNSLHINLGNVLNGAGRTEEAAAEYREAVRLDENSVLAHYSLALALSRLKRYDEAAAEFRTVLQLEPNHKAAAARWASMEAERRGH